MKRILWMTAMLLLVPAMALAATVTLSWTDNATNETTQNIERATGTCASFPTFAPLASVGANVVTYADTTVVVGQTYCYRLNAQNSAGISAYSNTAGIQFTVPAPPSGLTAQ